MEKIIITLNQSGFTNKEATVYTALLSCGTASAYTIAEKTGLKPSTTYLILQNLIQKNFIYSIPRAKKKLFSARDPKDIVSEIEKKAAQAKKILPAMLALIPAETLKIKIKYYQGLSGIEESLNYSQKHSIPTSEVVGFYASAENVPEEYIEMSKKFMHDLKKRNIKVRGITPEHRSIEEMKMIHEMLGHSLRTIPYKDYSAQTSIEAEDSIVRVILNHEEKAIVIENIELAKMVKQIFEMVWKK